MTAEKRCTVCEALEEARRFLGSLTPCEIHGDVQMEQYPKYKPDEEAYKKAFGEKAGAGLAEVVRRENERLAVIEQDHQAMEKIRQGGEGACLQRLADGKWFFTEGSSARLFRPFCTDPAAAVLGGQDEQR